MRISNFTDLIECDDSSLNICHPNATCSNTVGSFECSCDPGFSGDGVDCSGMYVMHALEMKFKMYSYNLQILTSVVNQMVAVVKNATISLEVSFVIVEMDMSLLIKHIVVVSFLTGY